MRGLGTIINVITVLLGGSLGLMIGSRISKQINVAIINVFGIATIAIGMQMFLKTENILVLLFSLAIGTFIGEILAIQDFIERTGQRLEKQFSKGPQGQFSRAFIVTSILFCVGPLTILGSIQDGLTGDYTLLATKAMLDGVTAIMFAATMGVGVLFTVLTIILVQGSLTLTAGFIEVFLTQSVIAEITAAGGIMMMAIGLGILEIKKLRTANMLPALIVVPVMVFIAQIIGGLL